MSTTEEVNFNGHENLCVVCFRNIDIYSVGVCNHAVCFECSTRMRVLCRQNECPICRQDLPKVIFTKTNKSFSELILKFEGSNIADSKMGILFSTSDIQKLYFKILEHRCHICVESDIKLHFKTFQQLKDHMRNEHDLCYCDICVDNLKIFTSERRCYTRQELCHHRRKGDPDNTSHRGHPLCEFCDTRYVDNDELFRHLRRQHFFCHFCDADGKHLYYVNMEELRQHFTDEHYLCEEGECKTIPLTAVFRTDIDLKAHIASEHSRYMSKSAMKQARTLELEFTLAPKRRTEYTLRKLVTPEGFLELAGATSSSVFLKTGPSVTITANAGATKLINDHPQTTMKNRTNASSTVRLSVNTQNPNVPKVSIQVDHQQNGSITTHITTSRSNQRISEPVSALESTTEVIKPQSIPDKFNNTEPNKKVTPTTRLSSGSSEQFPALCGMCENDDVYIKNEEKYSETNTDEKSNDIPHINRKVLKSESTKNDNLKSKNGLINENVSCNPPPGFNGRHHPGFSLSSFPSLNSIANDLTFTSSSGHSYSITPSITYHPPNNFQVRNHKLIQKAMQILDKDTIKEFKTYSDLFRNGAFPVTNYYKHCKTVLGSSFEEIFPELLVLLPDVRKQQELLKIYDGASKLNLLVCEHCKQIIYKRELSEHYNYHLMEDQFPSLVVTK